MTPRPVIRNAQGLAVDEIQTLRDAVELTVGQEIALLYGPDSFRQIGQEAYWHTHDNVVDRLYPTDPHEIAFLLGKPPPKDDDQAEHHDTELYELLSFSHDEVQARFGGENLVVVSVSPDGGIRLRQLIKLQAEGDVRLHAAQS